MLTVSPLSHHMTREEKNEERNKVREVVVVVKRERRSSSESPPTLFLSSSCTRVASPELGIINTDPMECRSPHSLGSSPRLPLPYLFCFFLATHSAPSCSAVSRLTSNQFLYSRLDFKETTPGSVGVKKPKPLLTLLVVPATLHTHTKKS